MAVCLALYALGVSLESRPHAGASPLITISIAFGALATLIFLGDLILLGRKELQRRRALEEPFPEYGALDYQPELQKAIHAYVNAQNHITDATSRTSGVFAKNQGLNSQEGANECGAAAEELCREYEQWLPEMGKNGEIARVCLKGFVKTLAKPSSKADLDELLKLRESTRGARRGTVQHLHAIKEGRKTTSQLRQKNLSRSLNESSVRLEAHLEDATKVVHLTAKAFAVAERQMTRRLFWYSVRTRLAPSSGKQDANDLSS
jgi:hypothetical protein